MRLPALAFVVSMSGLALVDGCLKLQIEGGELRCSTARHCPSPYVCHLDDLRCYPPATETLDGSVDEALEVAGDTSDASLDTGLDALGDTSIGDTSVGDISVGETSIGDTSVGDTSVGDSSLEHQADLGAEDVGQEVAPPKSANLVITKAGNGAGTVMAMWTGGNLNCGATCSAVVPQGTTVTLQVTVAQGSTAAWGAPCSGSGACVVTVAPGGTTVPVTLTLTQFLLSVTLAGPSMTGSVVATTSGIGIDCGSTCAANVNYDTSVQLVATPSASGVFSSWTGCDSVTATTTCNVTVTQARTATAVFKRRAGYACASGGDCASASCTGGVCCAITCPNANCYTCAAGTGSCTPLPSRTACGTRTGSAGAGNGSDIALICDGNGTCAAPTINCPSEVGLQSCDLNSNFCCAGMLSGPACFSDASTCYAPNGGYACHTSTDCPLTEGVCCSNSLSFATCAATCDAADTLP